MRCECRTYVVRLPHGPARPRQNPHRSDLGAAPVIVSPNDLEVRLRANGIERLVLELQLAGAAQPEEALA